MQLIWHYIQVQGPLQGHILWKRWRHRVHPTPTVIASWLWILCLLRNTTRLAEKITFESKHACKWGEPFIRMDHDECQLWFHPEHVSSKLKYLPTCAVSMRHYLQIKTKRQESVSLDRKVKCSLLSSHAPIKYLTPTSKAKQLKLATQEHKCMKRRLKK